MARHILDDRGWGEIATTAEPCGWFGADECSVKVTGSSDQEKVVVECKQFTNLPTCSLFMAAKKTSKYHSTIVRLQDFFWSLNIMQHLVHSRNCSAQISVKDFKVKLNLPFIDELEQNNVKKDTERAQLSSLFKIILLAKNCNGL